MNKLTTLLVGTGLAGAAILGAVAPATAAPTTPNTTASTQAAGDRVEGVVNFDANGQNVSSWLDSPSEAWQGLAAFLPTGLHIPSRAWELPAVGTSGPITGTGAYADLCLTDLTTTAHWQSCTGAANQNFILQAQAAPRGYIISPEARRDVAVYSASAPASGYQTIVKFMDVTRVGAAVITNYDTLTPVGAVSTPVDVTGPAAGESVADETPVFSGTGEPGAEIVVKDAAGNELGKTTVGADGSWSVESGVVLPDGPTTVTVEQTDAAGNVTSDTVDFIVAAGPSIPVIAPVVALGALGLAGAGALVGARRRKTARV